LRRIAEAIHEADIAPPPPIYFLSDSHSYWLLYKFEFDFDFNLEQRQIGHRQNQIHRSESYLFFEECTPFPALTEKGPKALLH
jgi:hypothetical protein